MKPLDFWAAAGAIFLSVSFSLEGETVGFLGRRRRENFWGISFSIEGETVGFWPAAGAKKIGVFRPL